MNIRNKILLSFSASTILLTGISFVIIFLLFSEYRKKEFQQQQKEKINVTIKLIDRFKKKSEELSYIMDEQDIHDFYDEKLLIYDNDKELVFSSLDDLAIEKRKEILNELSPNKIWIEAKEHAYDLVGIYVETDGKVYYAISKAYDAWGYDKLAFLRKILIITFVVIVISVLFTSLFFANHISKPINRLAFLLSQYNLNGAHNNRPIENQTTTKELQYLTKRFNELLAHTKEVFVFQKNTINHISHQLKTPVTVLVSELEKIQQKDDIDSIKEDLIVQTQQAKSLGDIITTLLEIAKVESGNNFQLQSIRIDEIIFDLLEYFKSLYPDFNFHLTFLPELFTEQQMEIKGNELLLKQAIENLLHNCIMYSKDGRARIAINTSHPKQLKIIILNNGKIISDEEQKFLFHYFFRGQNSSGKSGNGLGLVLTKKIMELHLGQITYSSNRNTNTFELTLQHNTIL